MARPRVVCFDLGGVLIRICRSFEEAALAAGIPLRVLDDPGHIAPRRRSLVARHQRGELSADAFHRALSELLDGAYTPQEIARIHEAILIDEYAGAAELVRSIADAGLVTACLSDTDESHWRTLVGMPSIAALVHRHASHLWGLEKPDPAIYRRFERELPARGEEILYFDDLEENVEAALLLGWDAVLVDHADDPTEQVRRALASRGVRLAALRR